MALATDRLVRPVEGMHRTIARRWFDVLGPVGVPARVAHDAIASTVYAGIRLAGTLAGIGLDLAVEPREETADRLRGFVTGVLGEDAGAFTVPMEVRTMGDPPTGHLVVLVHGLTETERVFDGEGGLGAAIDDDPVLTAVGVRYHTGQSVADAGARLADLLEELVGTWPVPVVSVALVGRSMGGLVARAACVAARDSGHRWVESVSDVVTIGTPHGGSWVATVAALTERALRIAPDTRPLADVLDARSAGIRDLDRGSTGELPAGIDHHFVAGIVGATRNPFGALVGDTLVGRRSAIGDGLGPTSTLTVTGVAHGSLHRHPEVVATVMAWLGAGRVGATGP